MAELPRSGVEWLVDAVGCDARALRTREGPARVFAALIAELGLHPLGEARWHEFPSGGGVTGLVLLSESHLACHTFPEFGSACFNLFCCRPRPVWPWAERLRALLGAAGVTVSTVERRYG